MTPYKKILPSGPDVEVTTAWASTTAGQSFLPARHVDAPPPARDNPHSHPPDLPARRVHLHALLPPPLRRRRRHRSRLPHLAFGSGEAGCPDADDHAQGAYGGHLLHRVQQGRNPCRNRELRQVGATV